MWRFRRLQKRTFCTPLVDSPNSRTVIKRILKHVGIVFLFTLIACLLLYPLPLHLSNGLVAAQSGDPLLQIWVVQWNIHKLTTSVKQYFDANIFYPYSNTFAYHDHLFALSLLGLPIHIISHNPIFTYNILLMLSFILSAYGMFLLCRELTGNEYAAFLAGLIFGFLPYRFAHLDHLNLLSIQWFPFCFLFLTRYLFLKRGATSKVITTVALFWGFFLLQVLSSFNYLFMLTFAIGIFFVATLFFHWQSGVQTPVCKNGKLKFVLLIIGGCIVGILLLPLVLPYLRANRQMGFQRTLQEAESLSARVQDYLVAPEDNLLYGNVTQQFKSSPSPFPREQILFNGILPVLLACLGIFGGLHRKLKFARLNFDRSSGITVLRWTYTVLLVVAGVLSLGPFLTLFGKTVPLPYGLLYKFVPGFNSMRVPARFGVLVFFAMSVLAALGVAQLYEYLKRSGWRRNTTLKQLLMIAIFGAIILLEYYSLPQELSFYPATTETIPEVYRWLAEQPEDVRIIELPLDSMKANFEYSYYSIFHWKQMINGRSAFIPNGIVQIWAEMLNFPSQRSLDLLKNLGIHYVILHTDALPQHISKTLPEGIQIMRDLGNDLVLFVSEKTAGIWENSGSFKTQALNVYYHIPSILRPGERSTIGVALQAETSPFCPLPHEKTELEIEWRDQIGSLHKESQIISFPHFFQDNTADTIPLSIITPGEPGIYQVNLSTKSPLLIQQSVTMEVTVSADVPDSRQPGRLRVQFLEADIPELWEQGKPLPLRILLKNTGDTIWKARVADRKHPAGEVRLGVVDWQKVSSGQSLQESHPQLFQLRGLLPYDVAPGEEVFISVQLKTPDLAGEYLIQLDMVSELIQWFANQGSKPFTANIALK